MTSILNVFIRNCFYILLYQTGPFAEHCQSNQIRCADGKCATKCDGLSDCMYGIDEKNCKLYIAVYSLVNTATHAKLNSQSS